MAVDVQVEIVIQRPRAEVAAFAGDPSNAPGWYANIKSIEWKTSPPLALGSRMAFVAQFLGKRLAYEYQVVELQPGSKLVMRTAQGPFPMETTYTWEDAAVGACRMSLQNRGEPSGFGRWAAPLMALAMRRAMQKDLQKLKRVLEAG